MAGKYFPIDTLALVVDGFVKLNAQLDKLKQEDVCLLRRTFLTPNRRVVQKSDIGEVVSVTLLQKDR